MATLLLTNATSYTVGFSAALSNSPSESFVINSSAAGTYSVTIMLEQSVDNITFTQAKAITILANNSSIDSYSVDIPTGYYVRATLASISGTNTKVSVSMTQANFIANTGLDLKTTRATKIAAFKSSPAIIAPAWQALTAVVKYQYVSLANGVHLVCTTAGTTAATTPVLSQTVISGRPITDGTAVWDTAEFVKASSDTTIPTVSAFANATAAGLTETKFVEVAGAPVYATPKGCLSTGYGTGAVSPFTIRAGTTSGGATGAANNAAGVNGLNNPLFLNSGWGADVSTSEQEFIVTDSVVALTLGNSTLGSWVEIDGQLLQGNPNLGSGTAGYIIVFDFNGVIKRRVVRTFGFLCRGVGLTSQGKVESGTPSTDVALLLGDSYWNTTPTLLAYQVNVTSTIARQVYKNLGFDSCVCANVGGSGYISQNTNTFNITNLLSDPQNNTLLTSYYRPNHIIIGAGFNDRTGVATVPATASALKVATLATWQQVRTMFPNAKITVLDSWAGNSGPDADSIALSALLLAQFNVWADGNSRFIPISASSATSYLTGTGNAASAITTGNASSFIGEDSSVHPTGAGARYIGARVAKDISDAWSNNY